MLKSGHGYLIIHVLHSSRVKITQIHLHPAWLGTAITPDPRSDRFTPGTNNGLWIQNGEVVRGCKGQS